MCQIRFAVLAIASFIVVLLGDIFSPGTWLSRAIATAMCTVFSFNSAMCTVGVARSDDRVVAATPPAVERRIPDVFGDWQAQRSREFDNEPSTPPAINPKAPSYPQDPGPNFPIRRPDFDNDPNSNPPTQTQTNPTPSRRTPANSSTSNLPCNPKLMTASAQPAQEVIVKGVPSSFTEIEAGVKADGIKALLPTVVRRLDNGDVAVVVPLHPTKGKTGGDVQMAIASRNNTCPTLSLRIEPLARAPGSTKKMLAHLQGYIDQALQGTGFTRTQLIDNSDNLPQGFAPLALLQWTLDNPNNPNSLKAILDGTAPFLKGKQFDIEILDGLTANSGINKSLESLSSKAITKSQIVSRSKGIYKVKPTLGFYPDSGYLPPDISKFRNLFSKLLPANSTQVAIGPVIDAWICDSIETVEILDYCMKKQREAEEYLNSQNYQSVQIGLKAQAAIFYLMAAYAVASEIASGGTASPFAIPGVTVFVGIASSLCAIAFAIQTQYEFAAAGLPSKITLSFDVTKIKFPKPDDPIPGHLMNVELIAKNEGYKFTASKVIEFIGSFVSFGVTKVAGELAGLITEAKNSAFSAIAGKIGDPTIYQVPGRTFKVDATRSELIEASADGVIVISSNNSYRPAGSPGNGTVIARTKPGSFGGRQAEGKPKEVTVEKDDEDDKNPPVITSFTCNGGNTCTIHIGDENYVSFSYEDPDGDASSWTISPLGPSGQISPPNGKGTIIPTTKCTCPTDPEPCTRPGNLTASLTITDKSGLQSTPRSVAITCSP